jgi:hypothetical protein
LTLPFEEVVLGLEFGHLGAQGGHLVLKNRNQLKQLGSA